MQVIFDGNHVNLDDPIDLHFSYQYQLWLKYSFQDKSISEKQRKGSYSRMLMDFIDTGNWVYDKVNPKHYVTNESGTIGFYDKGSDILLIYLGSMPGHEERLGYPIMSVPNHIEELDVDIICAREDPLMKPEYLYPCSYFLGVDAEYNTFEKMCDYIRSIIKKQYKKVVVFGDSRHSAVPVSVAHYLKDIVTNCFIVHGQSIWDFDESPWVNNHLTYPNLINCPYPTPFPAISHVVRSYVLTKKMNINHKYLCPYSYLDEILNIKVDYFYGKYDDDHKQFLDLVMGYKNENIDFHSVDYRLGKGSGHFIRPIIDRKIFPEYIESLRNA